LRAEALNQQIHDIVTAAPRGEILDDTGRPFADNRTALVVSVDRIALLRQHDGGVAVLHRLASLLRVGYAQLNAKLQLCGPGAPHGCWNGSPYQPIPVTQLKDDLASTRLALQILERKSDFPGVSAELAAVRQYPQPGRAQASQILGYLAPITQQELAKLPATEQDVHRSDLVGREGLEQAYNSYLAGHAGVTVVAVDHLGAVTSTVRQTPPQPGDVLVASLNATVQASLESALADAIKRAHATPASAGGGPHADFAAGVVLDAQTGHVIAMASYPSYNPNLFVGGISETDYQALQREQGDPLLDKAYVSAYPPGSTFKLISTAGLLEDGTASTGGSYDCTSSFDVGGRSFRNFEGEAFGYISLHETIVKSCDTVYYYLANQDWRRDNALTLAHQRPVEGVQHMARAFGLGEAINVDLPGATSGHIADRHNTLLRWQETRSNYCEGAKRRPKGSYLQLLDAEYCTDGWRFNPGDQLNEDIGQGTVLVSPLQLAVAYAALANGGTVWSPRLGEALLSPAGALIERIKAPVRDRLPASMTPYLDYIRAAMYDVPISGTASSAFAGFPMNQVLVGGKTGTAEVGVTGNDTSAWFASFAGRPGQPPQFVTVITVDRGGQGGVVAAPSVREVWDSVFGVEGHTAAFPTGRAPWALPLLHPRAPAHRTHGVRHPSPSPSPSLLLPTFLLAPAARSLRRRRRRSAR
jgi:penicillin-binding protein 2